MAAVATVEVGTADATVEVATDFALGPRHATSRRRTRSTSVSAVPPTAVRVPPGIETARKKKSRSDSIGCKGRIGSATSGRQADALELGRNPPAAPSSVA